MSSNRRNRQQGISQQKRFLTDLTAWGLRAYTLGEQGVADIGDIVTIDSANHPWICESKRTQNLAVRATLLKAEDKAPDDHSAIVAWQPVKEESEGGKRMPDGKPLAILRWEELLVLLSSQSPKARV